MIDFWFYIKLGLEHVLDVTAYDHILFLAALTVPFTLTSWKRVAILATVFTVTHCLSLTASAYKWMTVDVGLIEFLIPVTILFTALFNLFQVLYDRKGTAFLLHCMVTGFFGLVHGFGFSNYFKMLVAGETDKLTPLLGFATGIEISQLVVVSGVLVLAYVAQEMLGVAQRTFIVITSIIIALVTIPMLVETFPW
ncbi:MAG: HupE/UreJ family protein [Flavobacteriaceae bacterium]